MKTEMKLCQVCKKETCHDVGRKQATSKSKAYTRRRTLRCRKCGTREINNSKQGRRIILGKNKLGEDK